MGAKHSWRNVEPALYTIQVLVNVDVLAWFHILVLCLWASCVPFSLYWFAFVCMIVTIEVVTVFSLQLSTVVLPLVLLYMVSEVSLVQPLDPQWTTPVTEGTTCKELADVPAWPTVNGAEWHQLAIVSCFAIGCYTTDNTWASRVHQSIMLLQCDDWEYFVNSLDK